MLFVKRSWLDMSDLMVGGSRNVMATCCFLISGPTCWEAYLRVDGIGLSGGFGEGFGNPFGALT